MLDSASLALENARLYEETVQRNRELALLNRVVAASAASDEIEPILETVCRELVSAFDLAIAGAALLDEAEGQAAVVADYLSPDLVSTFGGAASEVEALMSVIRGMTFPVKGHQAFEALIERQTLVFIEAWDDRQSTDEAGSSQDDRRSDLLCGGGSGSWAASTCILGAGS